MNDAPKALSVENSTDEQLLVFARSGDESAVSELIKRMTPLARMYALNYKNSCTVGYEDLTQEGMLGLLDAVDGYDSEKGVSFKTYAGVCINNRIVSAVRRWVAGKNYPLNSYVCLDEERLAEKIGNGGDEIVTLEEMCRINEIIDKQLSPFERQVIKKHLCGYSYGEIALMTSSTVKSVDNAIQRVRRKLRCE